jgi:hypothetical protein
MHGFLQIDADHALEHYQPGFIKRFMQMEEEAGEGPGEYDA